MNKRPTPEELLKVIRTHCLDCSGGSRREVHRCTIKKCALWPYRKEDVQKHDENIKGQMTIYDLGAGEKR